MKRKINVEDFDRQVNQLIHEGWSVNNVEKIEYYNVTLTKESGQEKFRHEGKIPFLRLLNQSMIRKICQRLNVKYSGKYSNELINEIETKFSKGVVITAYNSILEENKKKKRKANV